jgi:translation initiation factor 1 (eIF-1/SUI1)
MNSSDEDEGMNYNALEKVVIGLVTRRGRKTYTEVHNINKIFDLERILTHWRKVTLM